MVCVIGVFVPTIPTLPAFPTIPTIPTFLPLAEFRKAGMRRKMRKMLVNALPMRVSGQSGKAGTMGMEMHFSRFSLLAGIQKWENAMFPPFPVCGRQTHRTPGLPCRL